MGSEFQLFRIVGAVTAVAGALGLGFCLCGSKEEKYDEMAE